MQPQFKGFKELQLDGFDPDYLINPQKKGMVDSALKELDKALFHDWGSLDEKGILKFWRFGSKCLNQKKLIESIEKFGKSWMLHKSRLTQRNKKFK